MYLGRSEIGSATGAVDVADIAVAQVIQRYCPPNQLGADDAGIVEGITRRVVLQLSEEMGLQVIEGLFEADEIAHADEMFLTSSTREVVPIAKVDGKPVGLGKPGPVTQALLRSYRAAVQKLADED